MKTIEVKEVRFSRTQNYYDIKNYEGKGVFLVKQEDEKNRLVFITNMVVVLPIDLLNFIEMIPQKQTTQENKLSESFLLELTKIISSVKSITK